FTGSDKAGYDLCILMLTEVITDELIGDVEVYFRVSEMIVGADDVSRIEIFYDKSPVDHGLGDDVSRKPFAETHYIVECSVCPLPHEEHALKYVLKFVDHNLHLCEDAALPANADQFAHGVEVAFFELLQYFPVFRFALQRELTHVDE